MGWLVSYDLIEFVNQPGKSVDFYCNLPKLPEDAIGRVKGLEKSFNFHGENKCAGWHQC